jgi:hypothetical protein
MKIIRACEYLGFAALSVAAYFVPNVADQVARPDQDEIKLQHGSKSLIEQPHVWKLNRVGITHPGIPI